jgi:hypothetical protein
MFRTQVRRCESRILDIEKPGGALLCLVRPIVQAKRATTGKRQARAGENGPSTISLSLVASRWHSARAKCYGAPLHLPLAPAKVAASVSSSQPFFTRNQT